MKAMRIRSFFSRSMELAITVVMVLIFFSIFLVLLNTFFPSGTDLKNLISQGDSPSSTSSREGSFRNLFLSHGYEVQDLNSRSDMAAVLSNLNNKVKSKQAGRIVWTSAAEGMPLFSRDAIQTLNNSDAQIAFDDQNTITMGENSLVIIKRLEQDFLFKEKRSLVVVVDGALRGRLSKKDRKSIFVEVATPNGTARIGTRNLAEGEADFKVSVNADKSSTISVYQGSAEFISQGKKIKIGENQASTAYPGETPSPPVELPEPATLLFPQTGTHFTYRHLPPRIKFSWSAQKDTDGYVLTIAKETDFQKIVYRDKLNKRTFTHGNLNKGLYYWRVTPFRGELEGGPSQTGQFKVTQDLEPPFLHVAFPPELVHQNQTQITGRTEQGSRLYIMGKHVPIGPKGEFQYPLKLHHGINVVVVESIDMAGNVNYSSRLINGKF